MSILDNITEEEYEELEITVHELLYDKFHDDILTMSSPNFHNNIVDEISEFIHDSWLDAGLCDEDDYEDIYDLMFQITESFFDIFEHDIPRRSYICTQITNPPNILDISNQLHYLKNTYQPRQRTLEWYEYRYDLITASNIWKLYSTDSQVNSLIYEKCKPFDPTSTQTHNWHACGSLQWGIIYETMSIQIYETMYHTKVDDFGCIQHPTYKCIGASPDGINIDPSSDRYGRMIEVKNIVNREITGIPKLEYWIQMQVQMETCDLNECDFIETRFKEYNDENEYYLDESGREYKGVILCFIQRDVVNSPPTYKYMPIEYDFKDKNIVDNWISETKELMKSEYLLYTTNYWYLDEFSCVLVKRNRLWFQQAVPVVLNAWETIVNERQSGYEHRMAKKRKPNPNVFMSTLNSDPNVHVIHNLPPTNAVCLVKLSSNTNYSLEL
jgi:hypothetical protein